MVILWSHPLSESKKFEPCVSELAGVWITEGQVTAAVEGNAGEINKKSQHKLQVQYWSLSHRELTRGGSCLIPELRKVAHRETALSKKEAKDIATPSHWDLCTLMTMSHKKKLGLICTCITVTLFFC